jgi:hypothetical protein
MSLPLKRRSTDVPFGPRPLQPNQRQWLNAPRLSQEDMKSVAAELRRRLKEEKVCGWAPPASPPVDKKLLADARLLLLLANGGEPQRESAPKTAKLRCGKCVLCLQGECGKCGNCLDKPKYGGRGARKQACSARQCLFARPNYREMRALAS